MAQVLVAVKNPLLLKRKRKKKKKKKKITRTLPRLLLGSFVKARIDGQHLPPVVAINNEYIHNDTVWVVSPKRELEIRKVRILYRSTERSFIASGIRPGERIVTTLLSTPVAGMPLRLASEQRRRRRKSAKPAKASSPKKAKP